MRTTCPRIGVPLLTAILVFGIARARAEDPGRYVIQPGAETQFATMLGRGEALPGSCTLSDGKINGTSALATYKCSDGEVVLELLHPSRTPSGGISTDRFGITVKSGRSPAGFVEAIADKVRAHEAAFQWADMGDRIAPTTRRWPILPAVVVAGILVLWALFRRGTKRKHRDASEPATD